MTWWWWWWWCNCQCLSSFLDVSLEISIHDSSTHLFVFLPICLLIYPSFYLPICLFVYWFNYLSICLFSTLCVQFSIHSQSTRRFLRVYVDDEAKGGLVSKVKSKLKDIFSKKNSTSQESHSDAQETDSKKETENGTAGGEKDHANNGSCQSAEESDR